MPILSLLPILSPLCVTVRDSRFKTVRLKTLKPDSPSASFLPPCLGLTKTEPILICYLKIQPTLLMRRAL